MLADNDPPLHAVQIEVEGLTKTYGSCVALSEFSIRLHSGAAVIIGANGTGKSTLLRCIAGLIDFDAGMIRLTSPFPTVILSPQNQRALYRARGKVVGMVSQDVRLWSHWTVLENVWRPLFDIAQQCKPDAISIAEHWLDRLNIPQCYWHRIPYGIDPGGLPRLSGGQIRKVALARAVAMQPSILLLDEFEAHLDAQAIEVLLQSLREQYLGRKDRAVLIVTHRPDLVSGLSPRTVVLDIPARSSKNCRAAESER